MFDYIDVIQKYLPYLSVLVSLLAVVYSLYAARKTIRKKEHKLSLANRYYNSILKTDLGTEDIYKSSKLIQETLSRLSKIINDEHDYGASVSFKIFEGDGSKNIRTYLRDIYASNSREVLRDSYPLKENKLYLDALQKKHTVFINDFSSPKEAIYFNNSNGDWVSKYLSVWVFPITAPKTDEVIGFLTIDTKEKINQNNDVYELATNLGESTASYIANLVSNLKPHNKQRQADA